MISLPPKSINQVMSPEKLTQILTSLVGQSFTLSGKPRTDGAAVRKLITETLKKEGLSSTASTDEYEIIPPKKKGVPRLLLELLDTYTVTTGDSYNLQVWNRAPNNNSILVEYTNGDKISSKDIRFVFLKIDSSKNIIDSVLILTPEYIEQNFGVFGKPTIKHQLLVSSKYREQIINSKTKILYSEDTDKLKQVTCKKYNAPSKKMTEKADSTCLFSMDILRDYVAKELIGKTLPNSDTKTRGQALERLVLGLLGYDKTQADLLMGGYPDIPNQLLEVKVQDTQTIDLGKYSPQFEEIIDENLNITTTDIRYLIALTNPQTQIIEGIILCSGEELGNHFTYVSDTSYKCQRSIPMSFFNSYSGKCVFNPQYKKPSSQGNLSFQ